MKPAEPAPRKRRRSGVVVLLTGVYLAMTAFFSPGLVAPATYAVDVANEGLVWAATALAGSFAIAAVFIGVRWPRAGRVLVGAAGVAALSGVTGFHRVGLAALLISILPALVLFGSLPFFGSIPTPEEEGRPRQ